MLTRGNCAQPCITVRGTGVDRHKGAARVCARFDWRTKAPNFSAAPQKKAQRGVAEDPRSDIAAGETTVSRFGS